MRRPELNPTAPIGEEIRRLREALGLTLQDLAKRVDVPWQTLQAYETARAVPPADRFLRILHTLSRAPKPFRLQRIARAVAMALAA